MLLYNLVTLLRFVRTLDTCNIFVLIIFSLYRKPAFYYCCIQYIISCLRAHWELFTYLIHTDLFPVNPTVYRSLTTKDELVFMVIQLHAVCCVILRMIRRLDKSPFSRRELTLKIFGSTCCEILIHSCN